MSDEEHWLVIDEVKDNARSEMLEVIAHVDAILRDMLLTDIEKSSLKIDGDNLWSGFADVERTLDLIRVDLDRHVAFVALGNLIKAAFNIGTKTRISPQSVRYLRQQQGRMAGKARKVLDSPKREKLKIAILAETRLLKLKNTAKFAQSIEPGIRTRVGVKEGETWPSTATIRRMIKLILEERQNNPAHS